jgi:hypothetical protein
MDNVLDTQGVPLVVFGGAVPELAPEDLPEGASPFNQDCDYNPGSVFTRGGRTTQHVYFNLNATGTAQAGLSVPGPNAPFEAAWLNPSYVTTNDPTTPRYAQVTLNQSTNVSNLVQYNTVVVNSPATIFSGSFNKAVTAGNYVFIAFFINDPNVSAGVEAPWVTQCVDDKGQLCNHVTNDTTGPNFNTPTYHQNVGFLCTQTKANGGAQTFTCTVQNWYTSLPIRPCAYTMTLIEIQDTANAGNFDPLMIGKGTVDDQAGGGTGFTTFANNLWTQNGLMIGVLAADNFQSGASPYQIPGGYFFYNTGFQIPFDNYYTATGFYKEVAIIGRNFMEPFSMNGSAITVCGVPNTTQANGSTVFICLGMNHPPNVSHPGLLPTGVDQLATTNIHIRTSIAIPTQNLVWPSITPTVNGTIFYMASFSPSPSTQGPKGDGAPAYPLGWSGGSYLQAGQQGTWYVGPGVAGVPTGNNSYAVVNTWGPANGDVYATLTCFNIAGLTTSPAPFLQTLQNNNTQFLNPNGVTQGSTLIFANYTNTNGAFNISKVSDNMGNTWTKVSSVVAPGAFIFGSPSTIYQDIWIAQNIVGAPPNYLVVTVSGSAVPNAVIFEIQGAVPVSPAQNNSQILESINFGLTVPPTQAVLGTQLVISGHQSGTARTVPSQFVQYLNFTQNSLVSPPFSITFPKPTTKGNTVILFWFVHDPNGTVEQCKLGASTDANGTAADLFNTNYSTFAFNDFAAISAWYNVKGGVSTYSATFQTNAAAPISASNYSVWAIEATGTDNAFNPLDMWQTENTPSQSGVLESTPGTFVVNRTNCIMLSATQMWGNATQGFTLAYSRGGYYADVPQSMRILSEYTQAASNSAQYYKQGMLSAAIFTANPRQGGFDNYFNSQMLNWTQLQTAFGNTVYPTPNWSASYVVIAFKPLQTGFFNSPPALDNPGPIGVSTGYTGNSGGATSTAIVWPTIPGAAPGVQMMAICAVLQYPSQSNAPYVYPTYPLGYFDTYFGGAGGQQFGAGVLSVFTAPVGAGLTPTATVEPPNVACYWLAQTVTFQYVGNFSSFWVNHADQAQTVSAPGGNFNINSGLVSSSNVTAGNMILVVLGVQNVAGTGLVINSVTNAAGDTFSQISQGTAANGAGGMYMSMWVCTKANGLNKLTDTVVNVTVSTGSYTFAGVAYEIHGGTNPATVAGTPIDPSAHLTVQLANVPGAPSYNFNLPANDGSVFIGSALTNPFGIIPLNAASVDASSLQFNITATENSFAGPANFYIYAIQLLVFLTPNPSANFTWIKTYQQTDGEVDTLALDAAGRLWDEDVDTNPGTFSNISTSILPNTYAKGVTFADIEYMCFSNLLNGTDVPRQWNGTNLDRISQQGPGWYPQASTTTSGGNIPIQTIVQSPKVQIRRIAFGTAGSPNDSTPGNLLVIYGEGRDGPPVAYSTLQPYTATFGSGTNVVLSGITVPFPRKDGGTLPYNLNGTYQLQGNASLQYVGGNELCPTFDLPSPTTTWAYSADYGSGGAPTSNWFFQSCIVTMTTQQPLPNVGVGSSFQITGTGGGPPAGYDGTWVCLTTTNSVQMTINSASITSGVAQYSYTLVPPSPAPTVGQIVTITNCLNGYGNGTDPTIFNGTFTIASVGGGNFTVGIPKSIDIPIQTQTGSPQATAVVGGTVFTFDAGQIVTGYTGSGGSVVQQGVTATGQRKVCYSFLTRSGFLTQPSPIYTFNVTAGGAINVTGLSPGPSNVVARVVFFTGANGGNFFWIPQDVDVVVGGVLQHNTKTIVNDNTSTTAQFNFSDTVLLTGLAIDIPGNNLFNCIELGSCRGLTTYASRMFAWGEQLKITNLRNTSFDGGFTGQFVAGANASTPLGWTYDPNFGSGGLLLLSSPTFGWSYQISNTGGVQSAWGMITQGAYQDEFQVPIIQAATLYSIRVTAMSTAPIASGNLIVDLFVPSTLQQVGVFSLPLSSLGQTMQIFTGTLLTRVMQPVPKDLVIRVYAQNIPGTPTSTIQIDRIEPFQTLVPSNTTALKGSYVNNQESFDLITGVTGPAQNMQPINAAAELFDLLYVVKERSWFSTSDNGVTEPNRWNYKEVSNKVGCIGQNAFDYGEGWMMTADREGVHYFEGGEPIKVSQEIQPVWDSINWQYGYTIWLRNDPEQRRFTVGIPIPTPNQWMPEFPVNSNPTTPNVILSCNYRELNTGTAIAQTGPIKSTYMGRLLSPEPARKWSFWNIAAPYSDFVSRNNSQWPQFYCTGYGDNKVFALLASSLADDGGAINSYWISYGFVKPEMADAKGLGLFRMTFPYLTVLATGTGTLNTYVYPESPFNTPYALDQLALPAQSQGDLELGVNVKGNRFFVRVGTNAVGSAFRVSKLVVPLVPDTWSPIRGWNSITA